MYRFGREKCRGYNVCPLREARTSFFAFFLQNKKGVLYDRMKFRGVFMKLAFT